MIDWYLDEDGYPDPEKDGKQRFFCRVDGNYIWGNTQEELGDLTGLPEEEWEDNFFSFAFVSGTIYDNPIMLNQNKKYLASLKALNPVDRARLLDGNWDARPKGANYFEREWVNEIHSKDAPKAFARCRAYDLASTERSQANKYPDPTAAIGCFKDKQGRTYYYGEYHQDFYDDLYEIHGQFCKRSGDRDTHILKQAEWDGEDTTIVLPVDAGAAGKTAYEAMAANFMAEGFLVKPDPTPTNKSKLTRFQPFATACENGLVYFLVDTFDKKTLEFIYKQMEAFNGERSTATLKDEWPDVCATAYNYLMKARVIKPFKPPTVNAPTRMSTYRKSR